MTLGRSRFTPDDGYVLKPPHRNGQSYPVDANGFVRQCAWCRRIADAEGRYRVAATTLINGASHGCCEACAIRFLSRNKRAA